MALRPKFVELTLINYKCLRMQAQRAYNLPIFATINN